MKQNHHHAHPEIWFRPSPSLSFEVLSKFFVGEEITATPRFGKRDETHPKGYVPGTVATLRLFDDAQQEQIQRQVRITKIVAKPIQDFSPEELKETKYHSLESIREDLSFFEGRPVHANDIITLVTFAPAS
ncbi:MAG TPA: hypothetical protein VMV38_01895 [Candidatus Paceibacterota bacterium]|nr:hypothetical protein [Candidatus Paceibacterota bacterium]